MSLNPAQVCVVGSLSMHSTVTAQRLPKPGETVDGVRAERAPGGKGAAQAVAAARAGAGVAMVGRVGRDEDGVLIRSVLRREPIHTVGVAESWNEPTGSTYITVDDQGENTAVVIAGANAQLEPGDVEETHKSIEEAAVLLLTFEIPMPTVIRAAQLAKAAGVRVILNVAPARPVEPALAALVDLIVVNEHEARVITGLTGTSRRDDDTDGVFAQIETGLRELGAHAVLVTRGSKGSVLLSGDERHDIPVFDVPVVDTSGAGDLAIGALAAEWAALGAGGVPSLADLPRAVRFSVAAGSLAVMRAGVIEIAPTRNEIEALLQSNASM